MLPQAIRSSPVQSLRATVIHERQEDRRIACEKWAYAIIDVVTKQKHVRERTVPFVLTGSSSAHLQNSKVHVSPIFTSWLWVGPFAERECAIKTTPTKSIVHRRSPRYPSVTFVSRPRFPPFTSCPFPHNSVHVLLYNKLQALTQAVMKTTYP